MNICPQFHDNPSNSLVSRAYQTLPHSFRIVGPIEQEQVQNEPNRLPKKLK